MKKLGLLAGAALIALSGQAFAEADEIKVGQKIYDRAFGRGCGACHDISSNPQLKELIKAGKLDKASFAQVLKEGRGGMPKAMDAIMAVGPVKKAGYTQDQAIDAVYNYLSQ
jgi:mono/diheme cytochrome c family protein